MEKEQESKRAAEEWNLRITELKERTEAVKASEKLAAESRTTRDAQDELRHLRKRVEKLEPWRDEDLPEAYLSKFERMMREAEIPNKEWASRLISLLSGKALTAFHNNVPPSVTESYDELKEALLEALGLSLDHCRKTFWSFTKKYGETPQEAMRRVESTYDRIVHQCETKHDSWWEMVTGRYLSAFSPEVADYVRLRQPKTTVEMANLVQQHYDGKQAWRDRRQFRSKPYERGGVSGLRGDGEHTEPAPTNGDRQGERHEYHSGQRPSNRGQRYGGSSVKQEPGRERDEKDGSVRGPVCFSCGKRGHKKFDCPNKIARVTSSGRIVSPRVIGQVGSTECAMTIDSGALLTMVRADLVKQEEYSGEMLTLKVKPLLPVLLVCGSISGNTVLNTQ